MMGIGAAKSAFATNVSKVLVSVAVAILVLFYADLVMIKELFSANRSTISAKRAACFKIHPRSIKIRISDPLR